MRTPRGREVTEAAYKHLGKLKGPGQRRAILLSQPDTESRGVLE